MAYYICSCPFYKGGHQEIRQVTYIIREGDGGSRSSIVSRFLHHLLQVVSFIRFVLRRALQLDQKHNVAPKTTHINSLFFPSCPKQALYWPMFENDLALGARRCTRVQKPGGADDEKNSFTVCIAYISLLKSNSGLLPPIPLA